MTTTSVPRSSEGLEREVAVSYAAARSRLEELACLPAGWLDGDGDPIRPEVIADAHRLLAMCENAARFDAGTDRPTLALLPRPALTPTEDGGVAFSYHLYRATTPPRHDCLDLVLGDPELPEALETRLVDGELELVEHDWSPQNDSLLELLRRFAERHRAFLSDP